MIQAGFRIVEDPFQELSVELLVKHFYRFECVRYFSRWKIGVLGSIPGRGWEFFSHHHVQNGSGAHPVSYPMGTRVSFLGGKAAGA